MNKPPVPFLAALLLCLTVIGAIAAPIADTPVNRQAQAEAYLKATPPKELFDSMTKSVTASIPAGPQRDQVLKMLSTSLDMDALTKAMKDSLIKNFTAEELKALADFYSSPVGKSAMGKMGAYTADLMPVIQAQMMKAMSQGGGAPGQ